MAKLNYVSDYNYGETERFLSFIQKRNIYIEKADDRLKKGDIEVIDADSNVELKLTTESRLGNHNNVVTVLLNKLFNVFAKKSSHEALANRVTIEEGKTSTLQSKVNTLETKVGTLEGIVTAHNWW